jgi:hypothetical protein
MARGVKFNIFEKSIFYKYTNATHVHIAAILKIFFSIKNYVLSRLNFFLLKCILFQLNVLFLHLLLTFIYFLVNIWR